LELTIDVSTSTVTSCHEPPGNGANGSELFTQRFCTSVLFVLNDISRLLYALAIMSLCIEIVPVEPLISYSLLERNLIPAPKRIPIRIFELVSMGKNVVPTRIYSGSYSGTMPKSRSLILSHASIASAYLIPNCTNELIKSDGLVNFASYVSPFSFMILTVSKCTMA
jgi:hypothetical protein